MAESLTVCLDFLQRALGVGEGGEPRTVGIFPGELPDDFPLNLPNLSGLRVIGGVRSVAPRWSFGGRGPTTAAKRMWRVFLDVPGETNDMMQGFQAVFRREGWEVARPFNRTFMEAEQTEWIVIHPAHCWQLNVQVRQAGKLTQISLNLRELEKHDADGLLSRGHPLNAYHAPLPTLTLPRGWRAHMRQGQGGGISSEDYHLYSENASELLPHLLPQLAAQGWALLHQEGETSIYRTDLGIGTLRLHPEGQKVTAQIVHITSERGQDSRSSDSFA